MCYKFVYHFAFFHIGTAYLKASLKKDFSNEFSAITKAPTYGKLNQLRIFIDKCSVEAIDADGKMAMTNLVFPTKPYNKVTIKGKGKYVVFDLKK